MGFLVTTLIFFVAGLVGSLAVPTCYNRGPSTNLFHLTLVITATVCCWMMWAIVYLAQMKPLIVPILSEGEYFLFSSMIFAGPTNYCTRIASSYVDQAAEVACWPSEFHPDL